MVCTLFDQFNIREILFAFHDTSKYILLSRLPFFCHYALVAQVNIVYSSARKMKSAVSGGKTQK